MKLKIASFALALAVILCFCSLATHKPATGFIETGALNRHCSGPGISDAICKEWRE